MRNVQKAVCNAVTRNAANDVKMLDNHCCEKFCHERTRSLENNPTYGHYSIYGQRKHHGTKLILGKMTLGREMAPLAPPATKLKPQIEKLEACTIHYQPFLF